MMTHTMITGWTDWLRPGIASLLTTALLTPAASARDLNSPSPVAQLSQTMQPSESWDDLRSDVVGETTIKDGSNLFELSAPYRASDPATVPITLKRHNDDRSPIKNLTLVVDENPAPVAAEIRFGKSMAPLNFALRLRVNEYSNIRAIAQIDNELYMHGKFVKASGGCSAPPVSGASAGIGQMRARYFGKTEKKRHEAQIMIRHPNFSGLQRDLLTHLNISAHFIHKLEVYQGKEMLFVINGGISISENPVFRFHYTDNGSETFRVRAEDTNGNVFTALLPKNSQT